MLENTKLESGASMIWRSMVSEVIKYSRIPAFSLSVILMPLLLFFMFGLPYLARISTLSEKASAVSQYLAGYAVYSVLGTAFYTFGVGVSSERSQGWTVLLRVTSVKPWVYLLTKIAVAQVFSLASLALLFVAIPLTTGQHYSGLSGLRFLLTLLLGAVPFSLMGLSIGYFFNPNTALPIANLIYLPLSFCSGLLTPIGFLPEFAQKLALVLPAYHYRVMATDALTTGSFASKSFGILCVYGCVFLIVASIGWMRDRGTR